MPEEQPKPAAPRCLIRSAILHTVAKDKTGSCLAEAWGCLALPQKHAFSSCCGQAQAQREGERDEEEEEGGEEREDRVQALPRFIIATRFTGCS